MFIFREDENRFYLFEDALGTLVVDRTGDLRSRLLRAEEEARAGGLWLAGGLAYEAASAYEPSLEKADSSGREGPPGEVARSGGVPEEPFRPGPLAWWGLFAPPRVLNLEDLKSRLREGARPEDPEAVFLGGPEALWDESRYAGAFKEAKRALEAGDSYQLNLSFSFRCAARNVLRPWAPEDSRLLFLRLLEEGQARHAAYLEEADWAVLSLSPELFFRKEGRTLLCRPMKGTAPRGKSEEEDAENSRRLENSEKDRAENLMIVDMIRNDLGRIAAAGSVRVPRLFELEAYPSLWQMTSTVTAELDGEGLFLDDLFAALFPCASITGAPKIRTMQLLRNIEGRPRSWYTGTLGYRSPEGNAAFNVLIRTLLLDRNSGMAAFHAGGGLVWDSEAGSEYREALLKGRFLKKAARDFDLVESLLWTPDEGFCLLDRHLARLGNAGETFGVAWDEKKATEALERIPHIYMRKSELPPAFAEVPGEIVRNRSPEAGQAATFGGSAKLSYKVRLLLKPDGSFEAEASPLDALPEVLSCALASEAFGRNSLLWRRFKTSRREIYDRLKVAGADQTLHYNEEGELCESTSMNVVLRFGDEFLTPRLEAGLLDGTFRAFLLETGRVREARLTIADLYRADGLFLVNSVRGWKKARLLPDRPSS